MVEMILGQTKTSAFPGEIVAFVAGSNPLDTETQTLFAWLRERSITHKTINVREDSTLAPLAESAVKWLPVLSVNGRLLGRSSLLGLLGNPAALDAWLHAPMCRKIPQIWATREATQELARQANGQQGSLRLSISAEMSPELTVEPAHDDDWVIVLNGVELAISAFSLARADGVTIRYVKSAQGDGFVFDNPNESCAVRRINSEQLQSWLTSETPPLLIDVRSEAEYLDGRIPGARLLDALLVEALTSLDRSTPLALYCNNGVRSTSAARRYFDLGFVDVVALDGGLQAWKRDLNLDGAQAEADF